jgi:2-oxoglutarate decarboxylase
VAQLYSELLVRRKDLKTEEIEAMTKKHHDVFEKALEDVRAKGHGAFGKDHLLVSPKQKREGVENPKTAVDLATLKRITEKVTFDPESIVLHPRIKTQVLDRRRSMVFDGKPGIDFGMAEILAYGTLLLEGIPVRMSGQDCGRGTFAHRHAVLYDINDGRPYIPLAHLEDNSVLGEEDQYPSKFRIYDSPLSEAAVLGFEYGYSASHPKSLVIWEAQFGDFFNGAQIQIDQFIASSEEKWGQTSRVTMFLPHGYDGQGPEHSSGRIERFLQLCAQNNMRVAICSTTAQFFHLLRRQAKQPKKPLIIFTHKSILRSEEASSKVADFTKGRFETVLDDPRFEKGKRVKRIVFCSGKIYWEIDKLRQEKSKGANDVRVVRVEQLYPFPADLVEDILAEHKTADVVWMQEEPKNCGAFRFVEPYFRELSRPVRYIGRAAAASPSTGSPSVHKEQQQAILTAALDMGLDKGVDVDV